MKQDYPTAREQDDAHKIPQTAQQSVAAPNLSSHLKCFRCKPIHLCQNTDSTYTQAKAEAGYSQLPQNMIWLLAARMLSILVPSLPETEHSSSWRHHEAEPRKRCDWD